MSDIILIDPLGRAFILADHTWYGHIIIGHPEMKPHRRLVEQAVSSPVCVRMSLSSADCRKCFGAGPRPGVYVAVVVDVCGRGCETWHCQDSAFDEERCRRRVGMGAVSRYEMIKGSVEEGLAFHFDVDNDVLYLRRDSTEEQDVFGEETSDGFILFRTDDEKIAGMTIVDFWKQFGTGQIGDVTLKGLQLSIEDRARSLPHSLAA